MMGKVVLNRKYFLGIWTVISVAVIISLIQLSQTKRSVTMKSDVSHLRSLRPEEVDDVVADPSVSDKERLASALEWTRKRESKIQRQADQMRAQIESMQTSCAPDIKTHSEVHSEVEKGQKSFCNGPNDDLQLLLAADAQFEGKGKSLRLDGVTQPASIHDKFKVWICRHQNRMRGEVRIQKLLNCNENVAFTRDVVYERMVRTDFGPDEFWLGLEGPELHSLTLNLRYRGKCTYDLPFYVSIPGVYHLNLVWYRENFVGAREGVAGWLPAHLDKPLGERYFVNLSTSFDESETDRMLRHIIRSDHLPVCDLRNSNQSYVRGRWVYQGTSSRDIFHKGSDPIYHRAVGDSRLHTWVRLENFAWMPDECTLPIISQNRAAQCISEKKVLFEGDSHIRMLYNTVLTYVCGQQKEWSGWNSQCGGSCKKGGMDTICMRKDGTASGASFMDTSGLLTFINFGQHFCDGERHRSFRDYQRHVDALVQKIRKLDPTSRAKVIWHETNMIPLRKDAWIRGYGDQRTNIKIALYNRYASNQMKSVGVPIIPSYSITLPLFAGSHDSAHIPIQYQMVSTLKFVLSLVCQS
eukprot:Tamp_10253.p1 GENE.Tamp_10253~~Tamp_10253.p1  ORF type:complete len:581 (+),score=40.33 Tamp_10253:44-1786(+)